MRTHGHSEKHLSDSWPDSRGPEEATQALGGSVFNKTRVDGLLRVLNRNQETKGPDRSDP
jgi:hypothetical protein